MSRRLVFVAAVVAAVAAAASANLLLLGRAGAGAVPVGRLTPRVHLPAAPAGVIRPTSGRPHDEGADD